MYNFFTILFSLSIADVKYSFASSIETILVILGLSLRVTHASWRRYIPLFILSVYSTVNCSGVISKQFFTNCWPAKILDNSPILESLKPIFCSNKISCFIKSLCVIIITQEG